MTSASLLVGVSVLFFAGRAAASGDWETKVNDEGKQVQSLKIEAPSMTEEDQYGYTMPDQYRCDACKVVTHHLNEALTKAHPTKNRRLKEWEYQELFDETCAKGFSGYGVALVHGQNVLSGPALKRDNLEPGMGAIQMGGETWEKRLGEICRKFVYEKVGEDEVYERFREEGELSANLCFKETHDCRAVSFGPQAASTVENVKQPATTKKEKKVPQAPVMDIRSFVSKLAKKHDMAKGEYTAKRSFSDWENLFVEVAQRIPAQQATQAVNV